MPARGHSKLPADVPSNGHSGLVDLGFPVAGQIPALALRLREAAKALGISDRTLWTWTDEGRIPHVRIGGTIIYPVDALREWLHSQAKAAGEDEPSSVAPVSPTEAD